MEPSSFRYRVLPRRYPPAHVELGRTRVDVFGPGCVSAIAFVVGALTIMLIWPGDKLDVFTVWGHRYGGMVLVWSLVTSACAFAVSVRLSRREENRRAEAARLARQAEIDGENARAAMADADAVTRRLHKVLELAYAAAAAIPRHLEVACGYIPVARRDLRERAYVPFWVAVERSAELLGTIADETRRIAAGARDYHRLLHDRDHDFPPFPIMLTMVPDPSPTANALVAIVRLAQTDHQFAVIHVGREAARVSSGGFATIADMLTDAPAMAIDAYADASVALQVSVDIVDPCLASTMAAAKKVKDLQQQLLE
jgi:hypothetical protein